MTREEREKHLDWLYRLKSEIFVFMPKDWLTPFADALDVAIKALEQEPKSEWEHDYEILKSYSDGVNEVLDKIKENIQFIKDKCLPNTIAEEFERKGLQEALDIIDRYKEESEEV